jgi:hypothetical protein
MCGIYGASIKPGANRQAVLAKFKILGIYNMSRGKDSAGIFVNGHIKKTIRDFDDFIEDNIIAEELISNTIIGHNRQGSAGYSKTINQAHPFLINENLVFTHNGTIEDTEDLCSKYGVKMKDFDLDSVMLGTLLYTEGHDVLCHYKGSAALAYTHLDDMDTLHLFHGESKKFTHSQSFEERPLFFMETNDGVFYSSLKESLNAIRENIDETPKNLAYNTIFVIRNGEFQLNEAIEIDRIETNITKYVEPTRRIDRYLNPSRNYDEYTNNFVKSLNSCVGKTYNQDLKLILKESLPTKLIDSIPNNFKIYNELFVYSHQGRYWTTPRTLVEGPIYLKKGGIIGNSTDKSAELLYFHRGVMLQDAKAMKDIIALRLQAEQENIKNWVSNPDNFNFAFEVSKYSVYSVTNLPQEYNYNLTEFVRFSWYKKRESEVHASFTPKYTGRNYTIKKGILTTISSSHREKCILNSEFELNQQIIDLIPKNKLVPGGESAVVVTFPQEDKDQKSWDFDRFFKKSFKSVDALLNSWGEKEFRAFNTFIKHTFQRDLSIIPTSKDLTESNLYMIEASIKQNLSIADYIEKEFKGDSDLIKEFYYKTLNNEITDVSELKIKIEEPVDKKNDIKKDFNTEAEENENEETDVVNTLEAAIIGLDDLQATFFNLQAYENSSLAQEAALVLITTIENGLSNLQEPLKKYKQVELLERIKKIKETKLSINGTL